MPLSSSHACEVRERRRWRRRRAPARCRGTPTPGRRSGSASSSADAGRRTQISARIDDQHGDARAARRARRSTITNGFSSSAISAAMMNSSSTGPAARRISAQAEHRERERDELHPARDDDRRDRGGGASGGRQSRRGSGRRPRAAHRPQYDAGGGTGRRDDHPLRRRRGRRAPAGGRARRCSPALREELELDFVVVNGENAAGGIGITPKTADELFGAGADVITLGNHTYRHREVVAVPRRAAEHPAPGELPALPARPRHGVVERDGVVARRRQPQRQPLHAARAARRSSTSTRRWRRSQDADHVLVDMHAEATSEKVAIGWYLDGRVTAVVGTHTHVPTNDARVLPGGTAYITDVGMTGARGGVIGVAARAVDRASCARRCRCATTPPTRTRGSTRCSSAALAARAGGLDRAGAAARRPEQREPAPAAANHDEVEVEPVVGAELRGDQHGRRERGHGRRRRAGAGRTRPRAASAAAATGTTAGAPSRRTAPDRERRVAVGLEADRAVAAASPRSSGASTSDAAVTANASTAAAGSAVRDEQRRRAPAARTSSAPRARPARRARPAAPRRAARRGRAAPTSASLAPRRSRPAA